MELSHTDLYGAHDKLLALQKETFDTIYRRFIGEIKIASKTGELCRICEIPTLRFGAGYPKIDPKKCSEYIIHKMTLNNPTIKVIFVEPNVIIFDWRLDE